MKNLKQLTKDTLLTSRSKVPAAVTLSLIANGVSSMVYANEGVSKEIQDTVVVTATRTEKSIEDVPATISVIDAEQIEREIANNIDDLIRYEPGVSVAGGGRFGLSGFTIRGISGDRVLTLVDSTPTADEFSFGPFLSSRRNFVDLDAIKSVEILRGPSSSSFGSNAIGGVVNFVTKDPIDYLSESNFAGSVKTNYSSIDDGLNTTVVGAFGTETLSAMIVATQRDFSETNTFFDDDVSGPERRSQNPQDGDNTNLFAKIVFQPSDNQSLSLIAENYSGETETDVLTAAGTLVRGVLTNSETGIDERERTRFSVDYRLLADAIIFDELSMLLYTQESEAIQTTLRERLSFSSGIQDRTRASQYQQENDGLRLQFNKSFDLGKSEHQIAYGLDYDVSDSVTRRDGNTISRSTGLPVPEFSAFPTRDFPLSEYKSTGVFLQNDISLFDGRLSIIPAVRHDSFELNPSADPIYLSGNPGSPLPAGFDESETSFKFGTIFNINDSWSVFAQFAEGFRAPALDAVNVGFTNFAGGYTAIPNPDLKPERGEGIEFGFRHSSEFINFDVVAYQNDYTDFIESLAVKGFNFRTGLLEFQARNLDEAEIKGLEMKLLADLGGIYERFSGFQVRAAYAQSEGENKATNTPINSIDPDQLVLGIGYTNPENGWGIEGVLTASDRKSSSDIDAGSLQSGTATVLPFETPGYTTIDLIGFYNFSENLRLNYGVFNLSDKKYFSWSEEFVQDLSTTNFDRLSEAGRNYSVSIKYNF
ncbi:MAG: TonB-dependent hemoglobin/transferrin/lactoferrin family receptor [Gammaproteobacteria bacterium]|nr:TonB-dependent hemoglobin/transferrin/lactoferrin family receptor [Gammaproteobacteria bacterium]